MIKPLCLLAVMALAASCTLRPSETPRAYFDFDSLANQQIARLMAQHASIEKEATIDGKTDRTVYQPDSAHWAHEMEMFRSLNAINKPVNQNIYDVTEGVADTNSNLLTKTLVSKRYAYIKRLVFYYDGSLQKLRKIEADIEEETTLYSTARSLTMQFDNHADELLLSSYAIEGVQKIILNDTVKFAIQVKVLWGNAG